MLSCPDARHHCWYGPDGQICCDMVQFFKVVDISFTAQRQIPMVLSDHRVSPVACEYGGRCHCLQVVQILRCCLSEDSRDPPMLGRGADTDYHGPFHHRFPSCSTLIRWSTFVVQVNSSRVQTWRRQPSCSCSSLNFGPVVACPLCATTDAGWWSMSLLAQVIDGYGRPCDHAETVATVEVPHFQFIAGAGGRFRSQQRVGMVAALRDSLLQFCSIFRPPSIWTLRPRVAGTPGFLTPRCSATPIGCNRDGSSTRLSGCLVFLWVMTSGLSPYSALSLVRQRIHALRQSTRLSGCLVFLWVMTLGLSPCSALSLVRLRIHALRQSTRLSGSVVFSGR